ncbi:MAG: 7-carboxy-7-deazaguanine synthase QueE [Candidatus Melainabacteria bacterium]|nr:7-carboxy-7-deazaguanine synthase QueE [Candidatus Melainabacteria bacterium]
MQADRVYLSEIYSAIQGEGLLVGARQIFIRFNICDLRCAWCDTPESLVKTRDCNVEVDAGKREFESILNPIDIQHIPSYISRLNPALHHSISFTGGEPLIQYQAFNKLITAIRSVTDIPLFLETGGHKPDALKKVINHFDFISMDFKLPSSAKAGNYFVEHKEFFICALDFNKNLTIKIVVTSDTDMNELADSIEMVKNVSEKYENKPVIFLQPVTPINDTKPPNELELLKLQSKMIQKYPYVRVVPQVHKLIGQR